MQVQDERTEARASLSAQHPGRGRHAAPEPWEMTLRKGQVTRTGGYTKTVEEDTFKDKETGCRGAQ